MNPTFLLRTAAFSFSVILLMVSLVKTILPLVGVSRPAHNPRSVVLPLPDGPTIDTISPLSMVKLISSKTTNSLLTPL